MEIYGFYTVSADTKSGVEVLENFGTYKAARAWYQEKKKDEDIVAMNLCGMATTCSVLLSMYRS